jgi:hypothetical protein
MSVSTISVFTLPIKMVTETGGTDLFDRIEAATSLRLDGTIGYVCMYCHRCHGANPTIARYSDGAVKNYNGTNSIPRF